MSLVDKIIFIKNMNIALISFQYYDIITFLLLKPLFLNVLLLLKSKTPMYMINNILLLLFLSKNDLLLLKLKASISVIKDVFFLAAAINSFHQGY